MVIESSSVEKNKNGHRHRVGDQDDSAHAGIPWTSHPVLEAGLKTTSTSQWNHNKCNHMSDVKMDTNNITRELTNQWMLASAPAPHTLPSSVMIWSIDS